MAAAVTMLVALLLSLSRSGALALGVSAMVTVAVCRQRLDPRRRRRVLASAAVVVVFGLAWADIPALRARVAGAPSGVANRLTIWRETMPIVRDFWLTGTGRRAPINARCSSTSDRRGPCTSIRRTTTTCKSRPRGACCSRAQ